MSTSSKSISVTISSDRVPAAPRAEHSPLWGCPAADALGYFVACTFSAADVALISGLRSFPTRD
eukprot:scaffold21541_cov30-Tisochrysis_lutea.AAC.3